METVLVTGATGFIGKYVVAKLLEKGYSVRCLVRSVDKLVDWDLLDQVSVVEGDVKDPSTLREAVTAVDAVIHLAAIGHVSSVSEEAFRSFVDVNEIGTKNLIDACREYANLKVFVHFSSTAAMGPVASLVLDENSRPNPMTPYQKSKLRSETVVLDAFRDHAFPALILRPCMVYGVGGLGEFHKFYRLMIKSRFPRVGLGKKLTPIVHVSDVADAAVRAMENGRPGESYIVASAHSYPMDQIRKYIMKSAGVHAFYPYVPGWVAMLGAKIIEKISAVRGHEPVVTYRNIRSTVKNRTFCIDKAMKELGYSPQVTLDKGIDETIQWYHELETRKG